MDVNSRLRNSNERLIELENILDKERLGLINHEANNRNVFTSNAMHFNYLSAVEKYTGFADDYNKELSVFKSLLKQSVNEQSSVINNINNINYNNEITSNLPTSVSLSGPVIDKVSYINDDSNASTDNTNTNINTNLIRGFATPNTTNTNTSTQQQYVESEEFVANEKVLTLPKIQPKPQVNNNTMNNYHEKKDNDVVIPRPTRIVQQKKKPIAIKVASSLRYKYEGLGFDVWKKNNRRPIYTMTELYSWKTFENDKDCTKLKRFLIKGGFKKNAIEKVQVFTDKKDGYKYGLIQVRDSQKNINTAMDKINSGCDEDDAIIEFKVKREFSSRKERNNKLFVKNFDIISDKDHLLMTKLFYRFGELNNDIFMSRDRNGDPYCFVTYRDIEDAIACEKNQNWKSRYNRNREPLWFNGRELNIQYVDDSKNGKNNNNKKRKNTKSNRGYNNNNNNSRR